LQEKNNPNTEFYINNLVMITLLLFLGGIATLRGTLISGFQLLMKHPDVAGKAERIEGSGYHRHSILLSAICTNHIPQDCGQSDI
jgi:cytochrome P450